MSNPLADRNLLFGILGVQRNIIGRVALVVALQAWVAAKSKGMAQILREHNAITENQHAILEECVDVYMARHGNDAGKCLAAICLVGPVRDDLQAIDDPELQAGLAHVSTTPLPEPAPEPFAVSPTRKQAHPRLRVGLTSRSSSWRKRRSRTRQCRRRSRRLRRPRGNRP